jgi:uncharacterized membrane protein YedE/YeeE
MFKSASLASLAALTLAVTSAPAHAFWWLIRPPSTPTPTPSSVPEIDASTGLIAVAVVAALLALAWERRRRAAR